MHTRTNHFLIFKCIVVSVLNFSANLVEVDLDLDGVVAVIVYSLCAILCAHFWTVLMYLIPSFASSPAVSPHSTLRYCLRNGGKASLPRTSNTQ